MVIRTYCPIPRQVGGGLTRDGLKPWVDCFHGDVFKKIEPLRAFVILVASKTGGDRNSEAINMTAPGIPDAHMHEFLVGLRMI